jgi:RnfABCDGE-type electron transport complex B subunit
VTPTETLAERLLGALPQTQCTRCGYPDCAGYAEAMAAGQADINQCPPGGAEGVQRLAALTAGPRGRWTRPGGRRPARRGLDRRGLVHRLPCALPPARWTAS